MTSIQEQRDAIVAGGLTSVPNLTDIAAVLDAAGFVGERHDYTDPDAATSYKVSPTFTISVDGDTVTAIAADPVTGTFYNVTAEPGPWWSHLRNVLTTTPLGYSREQRIETMRRNWQP